MNWQKTKLDKIGQSAPANRKRVPPSLFIWKWMSHNVTVSQSSCDFRIVNFVNPAPQSITFRFHERVTSRSEKILLTDCWIFFEDPLPASLSKSPRKSWHVATSRKKVPKLHVISRWARRKSFHVFIYLRRAEFITTSLSISGWVTPACACHVLLFFLLASCAGNCCWKPVHCLWPYLPRARRRRPVSGTSKARWSSRALTGP